MRIDLPEDADEDETAAIAAAVNAYVRARMGATADEGAGDERGWADRRWSFAARVGDLQRRRVRVPRYAPTDPWTASGRTRRMR
jgi:hypothetical protein